MRIPNAAALLLALAGPLLMAEQKPPAVHLKKLTPNLYADEIESSVRFWMERLGFEKVLEVPAGAKLAFALLKKGDIELMYGTYASLAEDPAVSQGLSRGPSFLYIQVENLEEISGALAGTALVQPPHVTSYGAKELTVKDPAGHIVTFAQMPR